MCEGAGVKLWSFLARLLSILAILSLLIAPMAAPAAAAMMDAAPTAGMDETAGMSKDMPCCPDQKPTLPGCQKSCPLMMLCNAKCFPGSLATGASSAALFTLVAALAPWDDAAPKLLAEPPPPRPPRT